LQIVQKSILDKGGELGTNVERPITTLIILPYGVQQYLCYTITISTNKPSGSWRYFVDARTGKILQREDMIDRDSPVRGTGVYWNNTPVDIGLYEEKGNIYLAHGYDPDAQLGAGFVFNNDTSPFPNYSSTLTRFKRNRSISAWDAHTSIYFKNAFLMRDPNNDGHIAGDEGITPGVNILANHSTAYGYFSRNFGWQPVWSNTGASSLVGVAHMGDNTNNSEWDKVNYRVKYGVGEPDETSSLENAAHEIGHAVTQSKIPPDGFKISGQSGSIGEHVSDLWATMLSRDGDYLLFNDRLGSKADRDFSNPASDNPIMWNNVSELQSHPLPVNMRDFLYTSLDQFGRHQNLGILDVRLGKVEPKLTKV
jgi:Zn-dependent metalloprotease